MTKTSLEVFQLYAQQLTKTYENNCLFFITELNSIAFIEDNGINISAFQVGNRFSDEGVVYKCINSRRPEQGVIPRNVYGKRLRVFAWPIINETGVIEGTYGVIVEVLHPVAKAIPLIAKQLADAFPEGAFICGGDHEKLVVRQASVKFDIPGYQIGTLYEQDGPFVECVKTGKPVTRELDSKQFGVPVRVICVPAIDQDDGSIVGVTGFYLPKTLAGRLQDAASSLSANTQEIASTMQEVAASAEEISTNGLHLNDRIREISEITEEVNNILNFIKDVADQTKILGLNAAIEAARSGEHGRGFGVVSEEIRKLSDQSKETASEIRELIRVINTKISQINQIANATSTQSQEQAAATQQVAASVMELAQMGGRLSELARAL